MSCTLRKAVCGMTATWALALLPASAQADVFLSGMPQGFTRCGRGPVDRGRGGHDFESIDIMPQIRGLSTRCSRC